MRIALVFQGLKPPEEAWSAIPWGLAGGLREAGHEPIFVRAALPRPIERGREIAAARIRALEALDPEFARLRSAAVAAKLRREPEFDALVQFATGFLLPAHPRIATFEDMTVLQAIATDRAYDVQARALRAWVERQGAAYARARACLTLSSWAAGSIVDEYGVDPVKVRAVGAGRNLDPQPSPRDWAAPRFLFVGFDWGRKNGDGVLRAFRRLRELVPEARLTLVGNHPPLSEPGVEGRGPLPIGDPEQRRRLEHEFETATCFVMPSWIEPYGIVYREAAAAGIPCIGTTAGGAPDAVGENGVCVDPADDEALFGAMQKYSDPHAAQAAGLAAARKREETTWRGVAERLLDAVGLGEAGRGGDETGTGGPLLPRH